MSVVDSDQAGGGALIFLIFIVTPLSGFGVIGFRKSACIKCDGKLKKIS